jgi:hypothetical protein
MRKNDHNIDFWENRNFCVRKLLKIAENCDHYIDPPLSPIVLKLVLVYLGPKYTKHKKTLYKSPFQSFGDNFVYLLGTFDDPETARRNVSDNSWKKIFDLDGTKIILTNLQFVLDLSVRYGRKYFIKSTPRYIQTRELFQCKSGVIRTATCHSLQRRVARCFCNKIAQ